MKTIKKIGIFFAIALLSLTTSCSSDDNGGGGSNATLGTVKARVAGANFTSMEMGTYATKQVVGGLTTIIVQGSDASGKAIQIIITGYQEGTNTYEISEEATISTVASYIESNISNPMNSLVWAAPYENSGVAGTVTITEISETNVKGTFNFTGKNQAGEDTKAVTNGAFNVNFTSN
ncbi:MAG: hypothetical protein C0525_07610 [Flavobacterium sp.]|uniref:DUF6252 family protein n=1 Tax=Flavobacterium sp. TaxID=239 RepID=UPI0025BE3C55|nr:DUF6252 family protein [Flavobacterium sp.]MBA4134575.1 hypothetical protein [Flavobacterium sp.]